MGYYRLGVGDGVSGIFLFFGSLRWSPMTGL